MNTAAPAIVAVPERYRDWVQCLFESPDLLGSFGALHVELVDFAAGLFDRFGEAAAPYDDEQVRDAIEHLFYSTKSNVPVAIMGGSCPLPQRRDCLRAAVSVYRDCFEPRCEPTLCHLNEPYGQLLRSTCYMLWDASPLLHWADGREVVLELLEAALGCRNPACQESALHGLGHLAHWEPRVAGIVDRFLADGSAGRPELTDYARSARTGCIQ